jgi:hypothetical protein
MSERKDPIAEAVREASLRVIRKHAEQCRARAANGITEVEVELNGKAVTATRRTPEAAIDLSNAAWLDRLAQEVEGIS